MNKILSQRANFLEETLVIMLLIKEMYISDLIVVHTSFRICRRFIVLREYNNFSSYCTLCVSVLILNFVARSSKNIHILNMNNNTCLH